MSGYSWTLPTPTDPATTVAEEQKELLLGKDIKFDGDFSVNAAGDYVLLSGKAALRQAIYHRLLTRPGEFKLRPEYGVGIQSFVKKRIRNTELKTLEGTIIDQLSLEERIDQVKKVTVERIEDGIKIGIAVEVAGETLFFRPFSFNPEELIGTI